MVFLWLFLPVILVIYYMAKNEYRNIILLLASLFFYAWGEPKYIILMLITITVNYFLGIMIDRTDRFKKIVLVTTIIIDVSLLFYFKYFNMFASIINRLIAMEKIELREIVLPIGISFYTFQVMSYIIDLYRGEIKVQKSWYKLALYISFFPQLIAGPIVKYKDVCKQIDYRICTYEKFSYGVRRFIYGLGKKVIISNAMAEIVDSILAMKFDYIGTTLSWCVALCYTMQIYFDFSGYSDMAIGLGKMFGFDFLENFNYPYISCSIQEFWRRWHISLSTWFKEYLYIPLGGNRRGKLRTYINLGIVFLVTGLWHGASYTFVIWGLWHGLFSILERLFLKKWFDKNPIKIINYLYTMLVVIIGWIIFRADSFKQGLILIKNMFIYKENIGYGVLSYINIKDIIIFILALFVAIIIPKAAKKHETVPGKETAANYLQIVLCVIIMVYSIILLIGNTYNPFIYFRF